jgi:hypothetical protein
MASKTQTVSDVLYNMGFNIPYRPEPTDINYTPIDENRFNASSTLAPIYMPTSDNASFNDVDMSTIEASNVISAAQLKTSTAAAEDANKYYKKAQQQQIAGAVSNIGKSIYGVVAAKQGRKTVDFANAQLDVQKQMINTEVSKTSSALMDSMRDATSQLQVITAAKNVDIRSQGVQSQIVAGGQDLGEDIANLQLTSKLQKSAIEYEKASNRLAQAESEQSAIVNMAMSAGTTILSFI